jgi:hypothetical protein
MKVVQAKCPGCQRVLRIPGNFLGGSMRCKQCGKVFQIRSSSPATGSSAPGADGRRGDLAGKKESPRPNRVAKEDRETAGPVEATEGVEQPLAESEVGALPVDNVYSPVLARYRRRSGWGQRLAVMAVVVLVVLGVAGAVYYAVKTVNSEPEEKVASKSNSPTVANPHSSAHSHPKGPGKSGTADANEEPSSDSAPDEMPFPRRALFICVSNYLYANPVSYGSKTRTVHHVMDRLATALHIPPTQRFELSDAAQVGAHPTTKPVIERTLTDFLNTSRAQDRIVILFAGHAVEIGEDAYLVPLDGELADKETLIPLKWVYDQLVKCKARQKLLIADVCRFDPTRGLERPGSGPMGAKLDTALANPPKGVQVWSACVTGQYSYEGYVMLRPGEIAHAGFFLDEILEAVGAEHKKRVRLGIAKPEDALPVQFLAQGREQAPGVDRSTMAEAQEVYKSPQTPRLVGEEIGTAAYDPKESTPPLLVIQPPPLPDAAVPADHRLVADILRQIDVIPPIKESKDKDLVKEGSSYLNPDALPPFSAAVLDKYRDDPNSPLRQAIEKAIKVLSKQQAFLKDEHKGEGDDTRIKNQILDYQKKEVAPAEIDLSEAVEELRKAGEDKDKEASPRWRANYEYVLARLLGRLAYVREYDAVLGLVRKDALPPRDPKIHSGWRLASQEKLQKAENRKVANEAKKILEKLAKQNRGTPWEILAKREMMTALGLQWQPTR